MRITNKMMTNNSMYNINNNKNLLNTLESQYSTGKKITRPSDDPIVAVRALKFRTNLTEVQQYTGKNIPDALNWMEVTESSLETINEIIRSMNTYCNHAANDYLTATDRNDIVENLKQYAKQIYQEGNTNYAGRYVFSGYKTNKSLVFDADQNNVSYAITEPLKSENLQQVSVIRDSVDLKTLDINDTASTGGAWGGFSTSMPTTMDIYRITVAYDELDDSVEPTFSFTDELGNTVTPPLTKYLSTDPGAYETADDDSINFLTDTGEIILGKNVYTALKNAQDITATYTKRQFSQNDLRPEHYFDCVATELDTGKSINYTKEDQDINYEVNFKQVITINTQGSDAFSTNIDRMVTEIVNAVQDVIDVENRMAEVTKMQNDSNMNKEQLDKLKLVMEQLESEYTLRTSIMTGAFQRGLSITQKEQDNMNVCVADLGGRYKRLLLTQDRLESQETDFTELLSSNEDADLADTIIKYTSANNVYNASLNAAAKLVQTSLLDYLR